MHVNWSFVKELNKWWHWEVLLNFAGATVRLVCKNTKYKAFKQEAKTDKNGYFFIMAPKIITTYASHKCKVYLVSSPKSGKCKKPTNLHYGLKGAILMPSKPTLPPPPPSLQVFTVGPFAFEPSTKLPCSHWRYMTRFAIPIAWITNVLLFQCHSQYVWCVQLVKVL